jgi:hypothetical protein
LYSNNSPRPPTEGEKQECGDSGGTVEGNTCVCGANTVAAPTAPPGNRCQPECEIGCHPPGEPGPATPDPTPPTGGTGPACAFGIPTPERGIGGSPTTWRLFPGTGAGQFDADQQVIAAPLALTTGRPETAVYEQLTRPNLPRLLDVDGDGRPDLVSSPLLWDGSSALPDTDQAFGRFNAVTVWRNLGDAGLPPPPPAGSGGPWGTSWSVPLYNQAAYTASYGAITSGACPYHFRNSQELTTPTSTATAWSISSATPTPARRWS